ncbi:MAG: hypothetical protein HZC54_06640 [Verrucomicrobia bacterium]|nr:hypothetical protein [Verrucomicrobiota bacterium]
MFDPLFPPNDAELRASEFRENLNAVHDETASILSDVTVGAIPKKTGDGTLGDSVITEDAGTVIVAGKLLSVRRSDAADALLLEIHNGSEPVLHVRINGDGTRIAFSSNRSGFSFQSPLDVNGAPVAMKPQAIAPLSLTVSDPPTQSEVQTIVDSHNALVNALNG